MPDQQQFHESQPGTDTFDFSERGSGSPYWTIGVFLLSLMLFAWVRFAHARKLQQLFKCFLSARFVKQAMREELVLSHRASIALALNFTLMAGLLLQYLLTPLDAALNLFGDMPEPVIYLVCCGIIALTYLVKIIVTRIAQYIMETDSGINEYIYNVVLFNNMSALVLVPLLLGATYGATGAREVLIHAAWISLVIFYVIRLGRGILVALGSGTTLVYLFLYLCGLEILPLVVIYGWFMSKMN